MNLYLLRFLWWDEWPFPIFHLIGRNSCFKIPILCFSFMANIDNGTPPEVVTLRFWITLKSGLNRKLSHSYYRFPLLPVKTITELKKTTIMGGKVWSVSVFYNKKISLTCILPEYVTPSFTPSLYQIFNIGVRIIIRTNQCKNRN
jgi:hypothetical protein